MSARLNLLAVVSPRQVARRCVVYVSMQQVWSMLIFNATNAAPTNTRGSEGNLHTILSTTSFLHGCWLTRSSPCLLLCTLLPFSPSGSLVYNWTNMCYVVLGIIRNQPRQSIPPTLQGSNHCQSAATAHPRLARFQHEDVCWS